MLLYNSFSGYPGDYSMVYQLMKSNINGTFALFLDNVKDLTTFQLYLLPSDLCVLCHIIYL